MLSFEEARTSIDAALATGAPGKTGAAVTICCIESAFPAATTSRCDNKCAKMCCPAITDIRPGIG